MDENLRDDYNKGKQDGFFNGVFAVIAGLGAFFTAIALGKDANDKKTLK